MKKSTSLLALWGLSLILWAACPLISRAVPYASMVSESGGTVTFVLNESADNVTVAFTNPDSTLDLGPRAIGPHDFSRGAAESFQIHVTKSTTPAWSQISDDSNIFTQYFAPVSVSINRNPASPHFGRIYVLETIGGTVTAAGASRGEVTRGIFVVNPDMTDALGQGNEGLRGDLDVFGPGVFGDSRYNPFNITVGDDDHVYIANAQDPVGGVYRTTAEITTPDPENINEALVLDGVGNTVRPDVHTVLYGIKTTGTLATGDLVMWCTDGQWVDNGVNARNAVLRWDIGAGPLPHGAPPVVVATPGPNSSERDSNLDVAPDGNIFVAVAIDGATGATGVPAVQIYSPTGEPLWNSMIAGVDVFTNAYALRVSPDNSTLAIIRRDRQTWIVGLTNGPNGRLPDLTTTNLLATFSVGSGNGRTVNWDIAGNLYVANRSTERLRIFSPGGTTTAITGSDGTFAMAQPETEVTITSSVATIYENDATPIVFTVTRTGNTSGELTVNLLYTGTAAEGVDFTPAIPTSVVLGAGVVSDTFSVTLVDNSVAEVTKTIIVALDSGDYSAGPPASVQVLDDDTPEISIALAQSDNRLLEGYAHARVGFTLTRKGLLTATPEVNLSYAGASRGVDFNGPESATFEADATSATFEITSIDNQIHHGNRVLTVAVAPGSGYTTEPDTSASAILIDDEFAPGTVLFEDNFADATFSAANWIINTSDSGEDTHVEWAYDYSQMGIPPAPNGSTFAVRLKANDSAGPVRGLSITPNADFTGDYRLMFDSWLNYLGNLDGGGPGSTHHANAGVGTSGNHVQTWLTRTIIDLTPADGVWFSWDGDGANGAPISGDRIGLRDYNAMIGTEFQAEDGGVYAAGTASNSRSSPHAYYSVWGGIPAPEFQQTTYPERQFGNTRIGSMGFAWHRVAVTKEGNTVTWTIDGVPMATVDASAVSMGSRVFVGYEDIWPNSAPLADVMFGLVANLRVETIGAPPAEPPAITGIQVVGGNVQIDFAGVTTDAAGDFTLLSSATVDGTYGSAAGANITDQGSGNFRATVPVSGAIQFYRIAR